MNKDKIQVGDLATHSAGARKGFGLVVQRSPWRACHGECLYSVYWFLSATPGLHTKHALTKVCTGETE